MGCMEAGLELVVHGRGSLLSLTDRQAGEMGALTDEWGRLQLRRPRGLAVSEKAWRATQIDEECKKLSKAFKEQP